MPMVVTEACVRASVEGHFDVVRFVKPRRTVPSTATCGPTRAALYSVSCILAVATACDVYIGGADPAPARAPTSPPLPPPPPPVATAPRTPPPPVAINHAPRPLPHLVKPPFVPKPPGPRPAIALRNGRSFTPKCGHIIVNNKPVFFECAQKGYGKIVEAARPLIERATLRSSAVLPPVVDHWSMGLEGPVRDQGSAPACTAFSLASAIDHSLAVHTGAPGYVSALHLWSRYHTPDARSASDDNLNRFVTAESALSYDADTACEWTTGTSCDCGFWFWLTDSCGRPVPPGLDASYLPKAVAEVTDVHEVMCIGCGDNFARQFVAANSQAFREVLAKGDDIWIAMYVGTWAMEIKPLLPLVYEIPDFDARGEDSAHAVLISGYKVEQDGTHFLLHNSWGTWWGERGYGWIHEETLFRNLGASYVVSAGPPTLPGYPARQPYGPYSGYSGPQVSAAPALRPVRARVQHQTCPGGFAPDSITAQCSPPCPDGSPRANGVCAIAGHCPAGYVNLYGHCSVAAPPVTGHDNRGMRWSCGPGGCAYAIPFGVESCSKQPECHVSCPAPTHILAASARGFSCSG